MLDAEVARAKNRLYNRTFVQITIGRKHSCLEMYFVSCMSCLYVKMVRTSAQPPESGPHPGSPAALWAQVSLGYLQRGISGICKGRKGCDIWGLGFQGVRM